MPTTPSPTFPPAGGLAADPNRTLTRLPLTAFERFQYWETRPGYPNQIVAVLDFAGGFAPDTFLHAVGMVLPRHPLLFSRLRTHRQEPREFYWSQALPAAMQQAVDDPSVPLDTEVLRVALGDHVRFCPQDEAWRPAGLEPLPAVDPTVGVAFRLTIQFNSQFCRWIMQTHHVVCDGVGGLQAIRELIQVYHWLQGQRSEPFPLRPLQAERLQRRGHWLRGGTGWGGRVRQLWKLPMKWIGLFGASKFLWRRPVCLAPEKQATTPAGLSLASERSRAADPRVAAAEGFGGPPSQSPVDERIVWRDGRLTVAQTKRVRQLARESQVTVNSWLLAHWLVALKTFRQPTAGGATSECYRLMVPTNERLASDIALSACNQVSMVYVDRWPREMEYVEALAAGIDFEMSVIRRWSLSNTFLVALSLFSWVPGLVRWYARRPTCWATSYVTNLGPAMDRLRVGQLPDRRAAVGGLTLNQIRLLPPLRPALPAALAVCFYADSLQLTLHYDSQVMAESEAERLLTLFLNRLKT